jgi:hypothetical protein
MDGKYSSSMENINGQKVLILKAVYSDSTRLQAEIFVSVPAIITIGGVNMGHNIKLAVTRPSTDGAGEELQNLALSNINP